LLSAMHDFLQIAL